MRPVTLVLALAGCGAGSAPSEGVFADRSLEPLSAPAAMERAAPPASTNTVPMEEGRAAARQKKIAGAKDEAKGALDLRDGGDDGPATEGEQAAAEEPERTRQWFPEAFLWQPLVETGDDGVAAVEFTVPDQLTTWRVLALAHDRAGHQSGAVHRFDGTLPLYVDPVVPGWLYAGDRIVLPVQAVNTTDRAIDATIELRAEGAVTGLGRAAVALGPGGSDVRTIPLAASAAGEARLKATLSAVGGSDAAERIVPVVPAGRPVVATRGGTLANRRTIVLAGPDGADPRTEEFEVVVFPGPLAVLQAELERVRGGARPIDGAYGFALSTRLAELSVHAGIEVDEASLRRMRILSWQRVVRDARAPDAGLAADLLLSLRGTAEHDQVEVLRPRLVRTVVDGQRADGTWARRPTSTLQDVLVTTAFTAMSLPPEEKAARLRASGAIERFAHEVKDPFTAAVILAAGLADSGRAEQLRKLVDDGIVEDAEGEPSIALPAGVLDAWGVPPTRAELLAFTVLALPEGAPHRADLASRLMQGWDARYGFGSGRADAVALEAIARALPGATDAVRIALSVDGRPVAQADLDPKQPKVPVVLSARPSGTGEIALVATPEVPGLAFVATRRSWVPWSDADRVAGVEVVVSAAGLAVGREGVLTLEVAAPSKASLVLEQGLPAGAEVDEDRAAAAAAAVGATIEVHTDRVVVRTRPFQPGEVMTLELPVTPAFAGTFQTVPLGIGVSGGRPVPTRPLTWTVGAAGS